MTLDALAKKFGTSGLVIIILIALLSMVYFGYQLAMYRVAQENKQQRAQTATLTDTEAENQELKRELHERTAELELTKMEVEQSNTVLSEMERELTALKEQLGFYQRVMAPEMTQDGFFIDGVEVRPAASPGHFRLRFVLLQQRNNKAVIKGELGVSINGSLNGKPHTYTAGDATFLPDGPVIYRFKFFQNVDIGFSLPDNFKPESLTFSTMVYQYTTQRGYYETSLLWRDALVTVSATP